MFTIVQKQGCTTYLNRDKALKALSRCKVYEPSSKCVKGFYYSRQTTLSIHLEDSILLEQITILGEQNVTT